MENDINDYYYKILEILRTIILFPGCSIKQIAKKTKNNCEVVEKIVIQLYKYPFGGIDIFYRGYSTDIDIDDIPYDLRIKALNWYGDISKLDKLPVVGISKEDLIILNFIFENSDERIIKSIINNEFDKSIENPVLFANETDNGMDKLYNWDFYYLCKDALINHISLKAIYEVNEQKFFLNLNPLGFVFRNDYRFWYLVAEDTDKNIYPYRLERFVHIRKLHNNFFNPNNFNLKDFVNKVWGMEINNKCYFKIHFLNEGNVIRKAKTRLNNLGKIKEKKDGSIVFEGEIYGKYNFLSWIRSFGSSAEIIYPEEYRKKIVKSAEKILENYENLDKYLSFLN